MCCVNTHCVVLIIENENDVLAKLEVEDIFSDIHKKRNKDQKRYK